MKQENTYKWTDEQLELANKYYSNINNLIKIQQYLTDKETVLKSPNGMIIRCIKTIKANYLQHHLEHYEILKYGHNIYNSIAHYRDFPIFSYNPVKRKQEYAEWTQNEKYKHFINGFDYYMDFDNTNDGFVDVELVKQEVLAVSEYLTRINKLNVPNHFVTCSGSGFHLKAKLIKENQNPDDCLKLCEKLINRFALETVDKSIYRWQGIIKTPYTVDFKTMRLCLPINLEDIKHFRYEDVDLKKFV